jgi:hypothetical protein
MGCEINDSFIGRHVLAGCLVCPDCGADIVEGGYSKMVWANDNLCLPAEPGIHSVYMMIRTLYGMEQRLRKLEDTTEQRLRKLEDNAPHRHFIPPPPGFAQSGQKMCSKCGDAMESDAKVCEGCWQHESKKD